jgi:hypothetical protein
MKTHYDWLEIEPSATSAEIEAAYESRFDYFRRLVAHHDPDRRREAQEGLDALDTARATLTAPDRRASYDASLGLRSGGVTDGVADPTLAKPMAPPQLVGSPGPVRPSSRPTSPWTCPQCGYENSPGTKFCIVEGTQLVRECPHCHHMSSMVATGICGECGKRWEDAPVAAHPPQLISEEPTAAVRPPLATPVDRQLGRLWVAAIMATLADRFIAVPLGYFGIFGFETFSITTLSIVVAVGALILALRRPYATIPFASRCAFLASILVGILEGLSFINVYWGGAFTAAAIVVVLAFQFVAAFSSWLLLHNVWLAWRDRGVASGGIFAGTAAVALLLQGLIGAPLIPLFAGLCLACLPANWLLYSASPVIAVIVGTVSGLILALILRGVRSTPGRN